MNTQTQNLRVLVVDDEMWYANGLADYFEANGCQVSCEEEMSASKALDLFAGGEYDLLVLDMMMPLGDTIQKEWESGKFKDWASQYDVEFPGVLSGVIVTKKIREAQSEIPIIFLAVEEDGKEFCEGVLADLDCIIVDKTEIQLDELQGIIGRICLYEYGDRFCVQFCPCGHTLTLDKDEFLRLAGSRKQLLAIEEGEKLDAPILPSYCCPQCKS